MLILRETGCKIYENSPYNPCNYSINLKLSENEIFILINTYEVHAF